MIIASDYYKAGAVGNYGAERVQAHESMTVSLEAQENLAAEGNKVTRKSMTDLL